MDFSSLEVNFNVWTSQFENQDAFILSKKHNFDQLLKYLPPFHIVVTSGINDSVQIILLAFNGKIIETEQIPTGKDLESSALFQRLKSSNFTLCHGVKDTSGINLITEYVGNDLIQRSKACLYLSDNDSNLCNLCRSDSNNNLKSFEATDQKDLNIACKYPGLSITKRSSFADSQNERVKNEELNGKGKEHLSDHVKTEKTKVLTKLERQIRANKFMKCLDCDKDIPSENFIEHIRNPHPPKPKKPQVHRKTSHEKTKECCGEQLTAAQYFKHREKDHTKPMTYLVCEECGFKTNIKSKYLSHKSFHHPKGLLICKICNSSFPKLFGFRYHYVMHTDKKPYKCKECDYRSNRRCNVGIHLRKVHKIVKEKWDHVIKDGEFEEFTDQELMKFCFVKDMESEDIDPIDPKKDFRKRKNKPKSNEIETVKEPKTENEEECLPVESLEIPDKTFC